ncbi:hypothetical protein DPMN_033554 [Dreissena polymorpha]|uniref:Uncharacterized protein n=1 Tax=Dreissena polymorpha TaxID=45954 RepID=A0A9D4M5W1_DREPO|nr:hypothetical protein DPMN_033554 [Dreissena polymorpha]
MKMNKVLQRFMEDLDVDNKNACVGGQALGMCLELVAPEYGNKSWNRSMELLFFLEERNQWCCLPTNTSGVGVSLNSSSLDIPLWPFNRVAEPEHSLDNRLFVHVIEVMAFLFLPVVPDLFTCLFS